MIAGERDAWLDELERHVLAFDQPKGSGYVVDCLHSARYALQADDYASVIRRAIGLGHDTDTTAAVAGGIAGIRFGVEGIPSLWRNGLRGRELAQPLIEQLLVVSCA